MDMASSFFFRKYQALLNDYILFDALDGAPPLTPERIAGLCRRRSGIGADGVLVVSREEGDFRMDIFNSDGSTAAMCGNGLRCVGKFLADTGRIRPGTTVPVRTRAGLRSVAVLHHAPAASRVAAKMGWPRILGELEFEKRHFWHVDVGNPHIVHFFEPDESPDPLVRAVELALELGPGLEHAVAGGVNVGFAAAAGAELALAVWERGAGFTEACGTGATAAVTAARAAGKMPGGAVRVRQRGGDAVISRHDDGQAVLEGLAHFVFSGEVFLDFAQDSRQEWSVVSTSDDSGQP